METIITYTDNTDTYTIYARNLDYKITRYEVEFEWDDIVIVKNKNSINDELNNIIAFFYQIISEYIRGLKNKKYTTICDKLKKLRSEIIKNKTKYGIPIKILDEKGNILILQFISKNYIGYLGIDTCILLNRNSRSYITDIYDNYETLFVETANAVLKDKDNFIYKGIWFDETYVNVSDRIER